MGCTNIHLDCNKLHLCCTNLDLGCNKLHLCCTNLDLGCNKLHLSCTKLDLGCTKLQVQMKNCHKTSTKKGLLKPPFVQNDLPDLEIHIPGSKRLRIIQKQRKMTKKVSQYRPPTKKHKIIHPTIDYPVERS